VDQASKASGGKLPDVTPGQQEKSFDAAIFKAPKGRLVGPVKTQFGFYVFQVTSLTPASQQSLAQAKPTIKQLLAQQAQQKSLNDFVKKFQKKWKDQTNCRNGFVIQLCKNAPKPKKTTTAPPGAVPQQGGGAQQGTPQQAPQQQAPSSGQ
jgi:foldase protein PrsA